MPKVHCKALKTIGSHKVYHIITPNQLLVECESSIPSPSDMGKPTLTIFDRSLTEAVEIQKNYSVDRFSKPEIRQVVAKLGRTFTDHEDRTRKFILGGIYGGVPATSHYQWQIPEETPPKRVAIRLDA